MCYFPERRFINANSLGGKRRVSAYIGGSPMRILIVDDNDVNRDVLATTLARAGREVSTASSGEAALEALENDEYDVVLMDVVMPGMDGYEATRKIRERHGDRHVVVAVTANVFPEDRKLCLEAGMNEVLSKPIYPEDLEYTLDRLERDETKTATRRLETKPHDGGAIDGGAIDGGAIDDGAVKRLVEIGGAEDPDFAKQVVDSYFKQTEELFESGDRAMQIGDLPTLKRAYHTLKGSSANIGAVRLAEIATAIDRRLADDDASQIDELIAEAKRAVEDTRRELYDALDRYTLG
ncbi:MAG: response regulator [Ignavibacteriales bacterium]|nr:response regulator [Ignavibacteriales bacterium]